MKIEKIFEKIEKLYTSTIDEETKNGKKEELLIEINKKIKKTKNEIKISQTEKEIEKLQKKLKALKKLYKKVK